MKTSRSRAWRATFFNSAITLTPSNAWASAKCAWKTRMGSRRRFHFGSVKHREELKNCQRQFRDCVKRFQTDSSTVARTSVCLLMTKNKLLVDRKPPKREPQT